MIEQMRDKKGKEFTLYYKEAQELTHPKINLSSFTPLKSKFYRVMLSFFTQFLINNFPVDTKFCLLVDCNSKTVTSYLNFVACLFPTGTVLPQDTAQEHFGTNSFILHRTMLRGVHSSHCQALSHSQQRILMSP